MAANEPLNELSTTDASNTPVGTDVVGSTLDNELRSIKANIARSARWEQTATQSVAVTLAVSALHKLFPVEGSVGGSTTITLPEVASAGAGFSVAFKKIDNVNDVIIDGNGAEQIDGAASRTMKAQYEGLVLVCNGSSWDVAADGERLVVPSFTVDGALNTGTLFVNGNEVTGLEGTVPAPANPGEDDYLLEASGGTWAWQSPANVKTNMSFGALADLDTVGTARIQNNAVNLDKLEHGASGDILYYGAAGEPFRLAKGTDTQVLTLASGLPSWADASSGGSWEAVSTITPTAGVDNTVDFSGLDTNTYVHIITWDDVSTTSGTGASLSARMKDGGTNQTSSNYDYSRLEIGSTTGNILTSNNSSTNAAQIYAPDISALFYDGGSVKGYIMFWYDSDMGFACCKNGCVSMNPAAGTTRGHLTSHCINDRTWTDFDGIGFYLTTSTFASGTFRLFRRDAATVTNELLGWT